MKALRVGLALVFLAAHLPGPHVFAQAAEAPLFLGASRTELYGKPLRGLTPVPLPDLVRQPERYAGRVIRISGVAGQAGAESTIGEGGVAIRLATDGSFELPATLAGASVTAEGKVSADKPVTFVASGLEVRR